MLTPNNIKFSFPQIALDTSALAVGATFYRNYTDGKPSETIAGVRLEVVLPKNRFEKISVKLPGQNHALLPDSFKQGDETFKVSFTPDFEGSFYRTNSGDYALTCKASGVEVLK